VGLGRGAQRPPPKNKTFRTNLLFSFHKGLLNKHMETASATAVSPFANSDVTDVIKTVDAVDVGNFLS